MCGILAGSGIASAGRYRGIAPECMVVCGKILDDKGGGSLKSLLKGLQWILEIRKTMSIRILNISVEMGIDAKLDKEELKLMHAYFQRLWEDGMLIVAAAGNHGPEPMSISPISENGCCICVGCHDEGYVSKNGKSCSDYCGRGPGKGTLKMSRIDNPLKKPDIVAPGTDIVSCSHKLTNLYVSKSGTSMATPMVSGACALFMQKYPETTNIQIKRCLLSAARDLGEAWNVQGSGMLSIKKLMQSSF